MGCGQGSRQTGRTGADDDDVELLVHPIVSCQLAGTSEKNARVPGSALVNHGRTLLDRNHLTRGRGDRTAVEVQASSPSMT